MEGKSMRKYFTDAVIIKFSLNDSDVHFIYREIGKHSAVASGRIKKDKVYLKVYTNTPTELKKALKKFRAYTRKIKMKF